MKSNLISKQHSAYGMEPFIGSKPTTVGLKTRPRKKITDIDIEPIDLEREDSKDQAQSTRIHNKTENKPTGIP